MAEVGRVVFMRHPETESNRMQYFSGRRDVALSEAGRAQVHRAARALVTWKPERIVCSPLSRCHAIADEAATQLGLDVIADERLIELEFGPLEGVVTTETARLGLHFPWPVEHGRSTPAPGAESFEDLIARARSFVSWVVQQPGKTACVTHGGFTRAVYAAVYHEPVDTFWNHIVVNVSSQVFVSDGQRLSLQSAGLTPEELQARAEHHYVPGGDIGCINDEATDNMDMREGRTS